MQINFLGHASFKIKTKTATVVTDPFPDSIGIKFPKTTAEIVSVSHTQHDDHDNIDAVDGVKKVLSGPGEYEISGVSVLGFPSYHDDKKGEERGKNTIYVFEAEGFRIAHLGDLGHRLSEKELEELGDIDILMLPVGGVYTIGPKEAAEIVRNIEPNLILPMHYKMPSLKEEAFGKLETAKPFISELGLPTEETKKLTVSGLLGDEQKIILLERS